MIQKKPDVLPKEQYLQLPPLEREHYIRNIIQKTVELNPNGVTANEIAKELGIDPRAVDKHLTMLLHINLVYTEDYDQTTVYLPHGRAMRPVSARSLELDGRKYEIFHLRNRRGEFVLVQEKLSGDVRDDVMAGVLIPTQRFSDFVRYLDKVRDEMVRKGFAEEPAR